ncbi:POK6 protein, partial [Upupa epops]|nr:POK6 protein [Upupa epops]
TIEPQKIELQIDVKTLNDLWMLLGTIHWIRPYLGGTDADLAPLFDLLKGDRALTSA